MPPHPKRAACPNQAAPIKLPNQACPDQACPNALFKGSFKHRFTPAEVMTDSDPGAAATTSDQPADPK
jgi:hypothetical protein